MKYILYFILSLTLISCSKQQKICQQTKLSHDLLVGTWSHDYQPNTIPAFVAPPKLNFNFTKDSFYLVLNSFTDIIADTNLCPYLDYKEYIKGVYTIHGSKLKFTGVFCNDNFEIITTGCYRIGQFIDSFKVVVCDSKMTLNWINPYGYNKVEHREIEMVKAK